MTRCTHLLRNLLQFTCTLLTLLADGVRFLGLCLRPSPALAAENLLLRKQLALYQERHVKPRRAITAVRLAFVWLSRWFDWRHALAIVQPETCIRWHRQGFRLFWRWKSKPGCAPIPAALQVLSRQMARDNPPWGQERITNELLLKLGLRVSPPTVRKYMPQRLDRGPGNRLPSQHMSLGPGIPQPLVSLPVPLHGPRHRLPAHLRVMTRPILGSLHHDSRLEEKAA
jgi:hypothetical protein